MNTDKKNQHYIPKFYLRNFSYQNNKKQIGVYNIHSGFFCPQAKLKTQGSKNFFYGCDGVIEDRLANVEGVFAQVITDIISKKLPPVNGTSLHFELLLFATITDLRNPVSIEKSNAIFDEMRKRVLELNPKSDVDKIVPNPSHDETIRMALSYAREMSEMTLDLDYKLLINNTSRPFISSDFPVVKYNQFLEEKQWRHSKSGYGIVGLQIFIPLSDNIMLLFYDKDIYKVGDRKKEVHYIFQEKDIDDLNKLQFLNCSKIIFFNEKATKSYIQQLHNDCKKYKRANIAKSEMSYLLNDDEKHNKEIRDAGFKNLLIINHTDCQIGLKIDGLKIHSKGRAHQLNDSMSQLRPYADYLKNRSKKYNII